MTALALLLVSSVFSPVQDPVAGTVHKSSKGDVEVVYVPAGEFMMGSEESKDQQPIRKVTLEGYWIGKNVVTVAQYKAFCAETGKSFPVSSIPVWDWQNDNPMVKVSWNDAQAFCKWAGGDLPTEAQWEKAARGTDGRTYPWGNEWDPKKCWCSRSKLGDANSTAPVGRFLKGVSPYGCLDMAGNVWQWCLDWYDESGYDKDEERNPVGPGYGNERVLRGGSWYDLNPRDFSSCCRLGDYPAYGNGIRYGFRLAGRSF